MISISLFQKELKAIEKDKNIIEEYEKDAENSDVIKLVVNNFCEFLNTLDISNHKALPIARLIGIHLALFEALARKDEIEKIKTVSKITEQVEQKKQEMNKESFKYSVMLLFKEYAKDNTEKIFLNNILKRISNDPRKEK